MNEIICAFRSRTDTMKFLDMMRRAGINGSVVNTPKEAMLGCGISVKFGEAALPLVRQILQGFTGSTFAGFFRLTKNGYRTGAVPLG